MSQHAGWSNIAPYSVTGILLLFHNRPHISLHTTLDVCRKTSCFQLKFLFHGFHCFRVIMSGASCSVEWSVGHLSDSVQIRVYVCVCVFHWISAASWWDLICRMYTDNILWRKSVRSRLGQHTNALWRSVHYLSTYSIILDPCKAFWKETVKRVLFSSFAEFELDSYIIQCQITIFFLGIYLFIF